MQREITTHITTIESRLSAFAQAQRGTVKTVEESNFSWAVVGGIAVADGPEPGPADAVALVAALGMLLFAGSTATTMVRDPDLMRQQAEALRDALRDLGESLARVKPVPPPETSSKPEPKPEPEPRQGTTDIAPPMPEERNRRNDCRRQHPFALNCEDPRKMDMEEVVIEFLMNEGYSFEDLADCRGVSSFPSGAIDACMGAPGERWHCRVNGTNDEISVFGCLCCHPDGTTGFEWRGAHWSVNLSKR